MDKKRLFSFYLPRGDFRRIREQAQAQQISTAEELRRIIKAALEKEMDKEGR